jgi:hypothetical protein
MASKTAASPRERRLTPLWIISLFVGLTEAVLAAAVTRTTGGVQVALTVFVIAFPLIIAGAFFAILWNRPLVLYAPTDYAGIDPALFVEALAHTRFGKVTTKTADLPQEVKIVGNPDRFVLLFKAAATTWTKSTKAMEVGTGCLVQVTTEQLNADGSVSVAEAVTFVPDITINDDERSGKRLVSRGRLQ